MVIAAASIGEDLFRAFLQGLPAGAVYALVALGFVLTYKTSGVLNLAFGAQAYVSAAMYFKATETWGWDIVPAFVLSVIVLAPLIGLILERVIFRYLRAAGPLPKLVVTIGLAVAIPSLFDILAKFEVVGGVTPAGIIPDGAGVFYDPFGVYSFSRDELTALVVAVVATLALGILFRFSAIGLQMRAVVESTRMTELNGIAADRVSAFAWALSSLFAGLAGVLIAPRFNTLAAADFFHLMVVAIAAAAIGRLSSLPMALAGGLGLGFIIAQMNTFLPRWAESNDWMKPLQDNVTPAIPFLVLFAVLVFVPSIRKARDAADPLAGVDPPPASIGTMARDPRRQLINRIIGLVALVGIGFIVMTEADQVWLFLITQAVIIATIFLSITVITGMAGQISLCQGAFAATGAFAVFQLVERYNMSVLVAAIVGGLIAAAAGALLSLPIRRLGGVWTAIATLAFAYFFDSVVVNLPFVGGGETSLLTGTKVPRPVIGPFDLANDKSFLAFAFIILVIVGFVVTQLKAGTFGRTLLAMRGSEIGAQSIGISPGRARLIAFAISGFIAAFGGALLAMQQENVNYNTNFAPFTALFWLVIVVTLGCRTVNGAVQAAGAFSLFEALVLKGAILTWILRTPDLPDLFPIDPKWVFILFGLGTIQFARHPEGVVEYNLNRKAVKAEQRRLKRAAGAGGADPEPAPRPAADRAGEPVP